MSKFTPRDFIAFFIIGGLIAFKMTGHNGSFDAIVALIVGYYFGRRNEVTMQAPTDIQEKK